MMLNFIAQTDEEGQIESSAAVEGALGRLDAGGQVPPLVTPFGRPRELSFRPRVMV
jgi:hypothetical protein